MPWRPVESALEQRRRPPRSGRPAAAPAHAPATMPSARASSVVLAGFEPASSRRLVWADMDSDGSESGVDLPGLLEVSDQGGACSSGDSVPAGSSGQCDAELWAIRAQSVVEQLRALAADAPSVRARASCSTATATEVIGLDVCHWEGSAAKLVRLQQEIASQSLEVNAAEARIVAARRRVTSTQAEAQRVYAGIANISDAELEVHSRQSDDVLKTAHTVLSALAEEEAMSDGIRLSAGARQRERDALYKRLVLAGSAAQETQRRAADITKACERLTDSAHVPKRQKAANLLVARASDDIEKLRCTVSSLQAELDAAPRGGGSRAEALTARLEELESDCHELQSSEGGMTPASESVPASVKSAAVEAAEAVDSTALRNAQCQSRQLVTEVKDAREAREIAVKNHLSLQDDMSTLQTRCEDEEGVLQHLAGQLKEVYCSLSEVRLDAEHKRHSIAESERHAAVADEKAARAREQHREVERSIQSYAIQRRKAEERVPILEWQLQDSIVQLEKLKPNLESPITKGLLSSKRTLGRHEPSSCKQGAAGSVSDAESSTAAGESAAELSMLPECLAEM